jgi:hypothetical protein
LNLPDDFFAALMTRPEQPDHGPTKIGSRPHFTFEHDRRANAARSSRGKTGFPRPISCSSPRRIQVRLA